MNFTISKPILLIAIIGWLIVVSLLIYNAATNYNRIDECQTFWSEQCSIVAVPNSIKDSFSTEQYTDYNTLPAQSSSTK